MRSALRNKGIGTRIRMDKLVRSQKSFVGIWKLWPLELNVQFCIVKPVHDVLWKGLVCNLEIPTS